MVKYSFAITNLEDDCSHRTKNTMRCRSQTLVPPCSPCNYMPRISTTEAIQIVYEVVTLIENNVIVFHYGLRSNRYSRDFSIFIMDGTRLRVDRKPVLVHPTKHVNLEHSEENKPSLIYSQFAHHRSGTSPRINTRPFFHQVLYHVE